MTKFSPQHTNIVHHTLSQITNNHSQHTILGTRFLINSNSFCVSQQWRGMHFRLLKFLYIDL